MHSDAERLYATLGVAPNCSEEEIRAAFRQKAKALHPDHPGGEAGAFIRLKGAYDRLNDPRERARYDHACFVVRPARRLFRPPAPARPPRRRGVGFVRYAVLFIVMGGLSFGFIEAMISWAEPPPAGRMSRDPLSLLSTPEPTRRPERAAEAPSGPPAPDEPAPVRRPLAR